MASPPYHDDTTDVSKVHIGSGQFNVIPNPDPALDISHEHHHAHAHHNEHALQGYTNEVVYSTGTIAKKSIISDQDPLDRTLHRRHQEEKNADINITDTKKGITPPLNPEEDLQTHTFSCFYGKYRMLFHLFIWLLFTGWV